MRISILDTPTKDDDADLPADACLLVRFHGDEVQTRVVTDDPNMLVECAIEVLVSIYRASGEATFERVIGGARAWIKRDPPQPYTLRIGANMDMPPMPSEER